MTNPPKTARAMDPAHRWRVPFLCLALAGITLAVFGWTLANGFVDFDDNAYVYENPIVSQGLTWRGVAWAFGEHAHNWHPLTWLSHMLDCQLYKLNPAGHHLTSVLLHVATVIALFLVWRGMTGAVWRSAFVAAVFAIHPLRVESVAWVAERKDVLSGLFFVVTLGAYLRYARGPSRARYALVALLFALGLMCKPMLVTLPLILLLLDYWPLRRPEPVRRLVLEKLPLLALSAGSCIATLLAQHAALQSIETYPLPLRLANALVTGAVYLGQMFYPAGLAVFYPYPHHGLPVGEIALAAALLAGLSIIAWRQRRRQPWLLAGWLWYVVLLLPVVGVVQVGNQAHADRYTYLPQIGICVAVTWMAAEWVPGRVIPGILMASITAALAVGAWHQAGYWKSSETLWSHALACTTNNDMAHFGLGNVLLDRKDWAGAAGQFKQAAEIRPDYAEAYNNFGLALFDEGKTDDAVAEFKSALQLQPDYADARFNMGNAFLRQGRWDDAIKWFRDALQIDPDRGLVHGNLGIALFQRGQKDDALAQFRIAAQLDPGDAQAHYNLGNALRETGATDKAIPCYEKALQIQPDYAAAHFNLGLACLKTGKLDEAAAQFQKALQLEPNNSNVQNSYAWLLATAPTVLLRDGRRAVQLAEQASARAGGKNPIYLRTLAAALAETGKFDEARKAALQAIDIVRAAGREDMTKDLEGDLKRFDMGLPLRQ